MNINSIALQQFAQFSQFANKIGDDKAVANSTVNDSNLNVFDIGRNANDRPYAFSRSADSKKSNNDTRTLFMNTLVALFDGEDKIPRSVRDVMKLGDFKMRQSDGRSGDSNMVATSGKPLTARRIKEIASAVYGELVTKWANEGHKLRMDTGKNIDPDDLEKYLRGEKVLPGIEPDVKEEKPGLDTVVNNTGFSINDDGDDTGNIASTQTRKSMGGIKDDNNVEVPKDNANGSHKTNVMPVKVTKLKNVKVIKVNLKNNVGGLRPKPKTNKTEE